jgi:lauroyl/myristoyl acyltransferase
VARATDAALWAAPWLSVQAADRLGAALGRGGHHLPILGRNVADNMRALGVYSAAAQREYFAQVGAHLGGVLQALRGAGLACIVAERIALDGSVSRLRETLRSDQGAVIVGPHIVNYLLNLCRLNQELPLTVYLRHSKDARRRAAKQRWYEASGVGWVSEAADANGPLGRLGRLAAALRAGRVLFITPDLPRKRGDGTAVRFFGREIYLPAGAAALALRSGAPLFMLSAEADGPGQRLMLHGPYEDVGGADGRKAAIQRCLQWFADGLEHFLRAQTPLWYLWGDKRWTRVLRGDPRCVAALRPSDLV